MPTKRLGQLLKRAGIALVPGASVDPEISGIQFDSRCVTPGDIYVAIRGHKVDGNSFVGEAISNGASAVVINEPIDAIHNGVPYAIVPDGRIALADIACAFYGDPTQSLFSVGVTGTKGKSSVCHMGAEVLGRSHTALISTITNALERGVEQTTPEASTIQRIAHEALCEGRPNLVLETSAHALAQERVRAVDFDVAVFTNLSHDHFDYFSNRDAYLHAKLKLFRELKESATAIVNRDDAAASEFIATISARILTFSMRQSADITAEVLEMGPKGTEARINTPEGTTELHLHMPGDFYIENAMAVVGIGLVAGLELDVIQSRLEAVEHIAGRFDRYESPRGFAVVIDFAHSPDSLERMLKTLKGFYKRVITVFGCGGDSDREKRPEMGRISGAYSALTIVTNDNPKYEDPQDILHQIERGLIGCDAPYELIEDRKQAIDRAVSAARPGDVLLIAGKGHEQRQTFDGFEIDFNDRDYLLEQGIISKSEPHIEYSPSQP